MSTRPTTLLTICYLILNTKWSSFDRKTPRKRTKQGAFPDLTGSVGKHNRERFQTKRALFGIFTCFVGGQNTPKSTFSHSKSGVFPALIDRLKMYLSNYQRVTKIGFILANPYLGTGLEIRWPSQSVGENQDVSKLGTFTYILSN